MSRAVTHTWTLGALLLALATSTGCPAKNPVVDAAVGAASQPSVSTTPPAPPAPACGLLPDGSRAFKILHLNDVYRIEGLADGRGGLARVRTLRRQLEADCPGAVVLTHAGDALFPSLLSRTLKGAQMIDVLNALDGDSEAVDPRMIATFGNHEFDKSKLKDAPMLQQRVTDSQFAWLDTNITWKTDEDGADLISGDRLYERTILDVGAVKAGFFGMTIDNKVPAYVSRIDTDYLNIAKAQVAALRAEGAEVVVAVTHLDADDDIDLLSLGDAGPDLVLGGHDHVLMSHSVEGRPMLKGDADAVRVRTVEIRITKDGNLSWKADKSGVRLNPDTMDADPVVAARVEQHLQAFEASFCEGQAPTCLSEELTVAQTELIAEETKIRRYETNLGDWIADRMLASFPDADVAVVNSGALRLNQNIAAKTPITRQIVEEIFAYPAPMHQVAIPGSTLAEVLGRSVSDWTGQGHWLQVAGVVFRQDPEAESVTDIHLVTADGLTPLDPSKTYNLVTVNYLLDSTMGDQDGYTMLNLEQVVQTEADGTDLKAVVLEALREAGDAGIAPKREGRICNSGDAKGACLLQGGP